MIPHVRDHVIPAAMSLLPERMDTPPARIMLLAIGLQESRFTHRKQVRGPARGFWQFEAGGVNGVARHHASKDHLRGVCDALRYDTGEVYGAIADNDTLAACVARLLLWTHPAPLPTNAADGWAYYLNLWRPGKPHPETWPAFYAQASDLYAT
jgi:hypothetical protein